MSARFLPLVLAFSLALVLAAVGTRAWRATAVAEQNQAAQDAALPARDAQQTARKIDFAQDIRPILQERCAVCHGDGARKGNLQIDTREQLLRGGKSGPAVVVGRGDESLLIQLVSGKDPDRLMPKKGPRLTPEQIGLLKAWIDQGLDWPAEAGAPAPRPLPSAKEYDLTLRPPALPSAENETIHPIDRILRPYFEAQRVRPAPPVDDRRYARRVFLDVIGLLPSPEELDEFLKDTRPDKRPRLVQKLLSDRRRYAEHWLTFWNDALRNDYRGTGYIDGGRKQITQWLYTALYDNWPYDRFTRELLAPSDAAARGFIDGIVWRGVVNASQTPPMQAAQNVSQIFLGANLKCASCHDSFINDWKLADAYGLAAVFADEPLEMHRCDMPIGRPAVAQFLYPQLGAIDPNAPRPERQKQLADLLTRRENGRFSRTFVNRLWARFLGRGLIEPVDEMDRAPWNPELLDWLAADFVAHGYDVKHTMEVILTSAAYQLPAVNTGERAEQEFVFAGPAVRRMSAEQFVDAVRALTGAWPGRPDARVMPPGAADALPKTSWVWMWPRAAADAAEETIYLRKTFEVGEMPAHAFAAVVCDNRYTLYLNGVALGAGDDYGRPDTYDCAGRLKPGRNVFAIAATNIHPPGLAPEQPTVNPNPAGVVFLARFWFEGEVDVTGSEARERVVEIPSDGSWLCSLRASDGWTEAGFAANGWLEAAELGPLDSPPWQMGDRFAAALPDGNSLKNLPRAGLFVADPLTTALGRPNREQVVTARASAATTLQALELTNGETLDGLLKLGAENWARRSSKTGVAGSHDALIEGIYVRGLGRGPTPAELRTAREAVGAAARAEGVEDLLWAVTMLPEFQLIY